MNAFGKQMCQLVARDNEAYGRTWHGLVRYHSKDPEWGSQAEQNGISSSPIKGQAARRNEFNKKAK
jgi:hypothetical protein